MYITFDYLLSVFLHTDLISTYSNAEKLDSVNCPFFKLGLCHRAKLSMKLVDAGIASEFILNHDAVDSNRFSFGTAIGWVEAKPHSAHTLRRRGKM